ncbi:MAG TPA: PEP-CTERM sorting domain-containing protein [Verrucomicrobiota bacterium]|nr:PEP-CTERM sorting domain-containing protein [Verrucomicrobiota bacterium]HRZ56512.1 PEP-CTERM sorting domain-containing protein [Candidatus Paceibacterota bacterium]
MKTTLYLMALTVCGLAAVSRGGVGMVNLSNRVLVGDPIDAPIFMPDCVTRVCGEDFKASLFLANDTTPITEITTFYDCSIVAAQGYFKSVPDVEVPGYNGGDTLSVRVGAWYGAGGLSYVQSPIYGMSDPFPLTLGNASVGGAPPTMPAPLTGLKSFCLVPEPSTGALCLLGGMVILFHRRREA